MRTLAELVALEPRALDYPPSTINLSETIIFYKDGMKQVINATFSGYFCGRYFLCGSYFARAEEAYDARERALQRAKNRGVK